MPPWYDFLTTLFRKKQPTMPPQWTPPAPTPLPTSDPIPAVLKPVPVTPLQPPGSPIAPAPVSPYPKVIHDADGGIFTAYTAEQEAQHAVDVARTQDIAAANAGPSLPLYTPDAVIPVPASEADPYVKWARAQNPAWDLIGAVNFFNAQPDETSKWTFAGAPGGMPLTNWIQIHFERSSVSAYMAKWEQKLAARNPFFPV